MRPCAPWALLLLVACAAGNGEYATGSEAPFLSDEPVADCEEGSGSLNAPVWYRDRDGDGWGDPEHSVRTCHCPAGFVEVAQDGDDTDPEVYPGSGSF